MSVLKFKSNNGANLSKKIKIVMISRVRISKNRIK